MRLDGAIAEISWLGDEVTPKQFRAELDAGEDADITVWINSPGGDVFAASEIYTMLKEYGNSKGLVTIKIDSLAASAASIIAMAGDAVEISPTGMLMLHDPWTITEGNSAELKAAARMLDEVKESIINAYEGRTGLPREKLARLMKEETWLNANRALELGFVDKIMFDRDKAAPAQTFSEKQTLNSVMNSVRAKLKATRVDAAQLRKRLSLLAR